LYDRLAQIELLLQQLNASSSLFLANSRREEFDMTTLVYLFSTDLLFEELRK